MLKYVVIGASLAFAAAVQPGPLQAYLLSRVTAIGWRRTLPAALAPLLSDGPIAVLALLVLGRLSLGAQSVLRLAGGALLLYLAWGAYKQWRRNDSRSLEQVEKVPQDAVRSCTRQPSESESLPRLDSGPWAHCSCGLAGSPKLRCGGCRGLLCHDGHHTSCSDSLVRQCATLGSEIPTSSDVHLGMDPRGPWLLPAG